MTVVEERKEKEEELKRKQKKIGAVILILIILVAIVFFSNPPKKEKGGKGGKWTYCYESASRGYTVCGKVTSLSLSSKEQKIVQMGVYFPDTGVNALFYKKGGQYLYHNSQRETGEWFLEKTQPFYYVGWVKEQGSKEPLSAVLSKK